MGFSVIDGILRAMAKLHYRSITGETTSVECEEEETVLEALERAGLPAASSCRAGVCETCLLRARSGTPGADAQQDLRATWRASGYFLACVAIPETDLEIEPIDAPPLTIEANVLDQRSRGHRWREVTVAFDPEQPSAAEPRGGQWTWHDAKPGEPRRGVVVGRDFGKRETQLAFEGAEPLHAELRFFEPRGDAFFVTAPDQRRLIVATDTESTAAAVGVIADALAARSDLPIDLFWPNTAEAQRDRAEWLEPISSDAVEVHVVSQPLDADTVLTRRPDLRSTTVVVCGREETLKGLRAPLFRSGASPTRVLRVVYPDAPPSQPRNS